MKISILYLDDERMCLDVFQEMFSDEYDVRTAVTLCEACQLMSEHPAQIVISDQQLPEIEGREFLRGIAATYPQSYRVMLTGDVMVGDMIAEISKGIIDLFISKPWNEQEMRQMLERASVVQKLRRKHS
jgi:DNA-binding NtrC family response regulator